MLNEVQTRNYDRCQKLHLFLGENQPVYNPYVPFSKEAQNSTLNFGLFQEFTIKKNTNGTEITLEQKELKNRLAEQVSNICGTATVYAEQNNNPKLATAMAISKSTINNLKDPDVYGRVQDVVNALQPLLTDAHFMEFDITGVMLGALMNDATTFRDNIKKSSVVETGGSIANKNINEVIKMLDKNVKTFDRLVVKFSAAHPDFVAGYRINAALENAPVRNTGIEGVITDESTGKPVVNALVKIPKREKETVTDKNGKYSIISIYPGNYEMEVSAPGFGTKTVSVRITRGKIASMYFAL